MYQLQYLLTKQHWASTKTVLITQRNFVVNANRSPQPARTLFSSRIIITD